MRDQLIGLLERADLALGSAAGVLDPAFIDPLIVSVKAVRTRLAYPEDVVVVALAGGTGSGKSSLFNALCEEEKVDVGGVRPTTSRPAAAVPVAVGAAMDGYLDRLGIEERHTHLGARICLLDLPDTDSVEVQHRHHVDSLLPLVDVVVWVTDPEKYRDARLHDGYLKLLSSYEAQFVFVLNQIDRLSGLEGEQVGEDLAAALREDGLNEPVVIPTAAAPPSGPPMGVDTLRRVLEAKRESRETLYGKLLTDLAETCRALEREAGSGLDFDRRAAEAVELAASQLVGGKSVAATETVTSLLEGLEAETGGITAARLADLAADTPDHIRRIESQLGGIRDRRGWLDRVLRRDGDPGEESGVELARSLIDEALVRPTRAVLARRAMTVASIAELAVEVQRLRSATEPRG